jgi:hypothetical protein
MSRTLTTGIVALLILAAPAAARAQQPPISAPCEDAGPLLSPAEQRYCYAIAQTVQSAQPLLGLLIAQGNPTPGAALPRGLRLWGLPPITATAQVAAVSVRLPDVRTQTAAATARLEETAPAISGSVSVELFPGFTLTPGVSGVGALSLIGSSAWLPFNIVNVEGLASETAGFAYGVGGRLGLLRETFGVPAASLSLMYRRLGRVEWGDVCPAGEGADIIGGTGRGYEFVAGLCTAPSDPGEFAFDLSSWSGRAVISKRLFGLGLAAGAGYDRFRSDATFGLGATANIPIIGPQPVYVRGSGLRVEQDRASAFLNGSYTFLLTTITAEAGWLQGGDSVTGFDAAASAFDPARGTLFGSLGVRVSF